MLSPYRSLFERKLGQGNPQYSLGKARDRNSPALKSAEDPFTLATPARGVQAAPREALAAGSPPRMQHDIRKPDVNQKWALVVVIAAFRNQRMNLKFTRADAQAMADLLRDPVYGRFRSDHIRLIADADATGPTFRARVLNWLARSATRRRSGGDLHCHSRHGAGAGHRGRELCGDPRHGRADAGRPVFHGYSDGGDHHGSAARGSRP